MCSNVENWIGRRSQSQTGSISFNVNQDLLLDDDEDKIVLQVHPYRRRRLTNWMEFPQERIACWSKTDSRIWIVWTVLEQQVFWVVLEAAEASKVVYEITWFESTNMTSLTSLFLLPARYEEEPYAENRDKRKQKKTKNEKNCFQSNNGLKSVETLNLAFTLTCHV